MNEGAWRDAFEELYGYVREASADCDPFTPWEIMDKMNRLRPKGGAA